MLDYIINFFRPVHPAPTIPARKSEHRIVSEMLESKDPTELIAALDAGDVVINQVYGRDYASGSGQIKICMDIYGAEVTIRGGELLDCRPQSYGLTPANAERLFIAIMAAYHKKTSIVYSEEMAHHEEDCRESVRQRIESEARFHREYMRRFYVSL